MAGVTIELDVACQDCGDELEAELILPHMRRGIRTENPLVRVEPCKNCLDQAEVKAKQQE